MEPRTQTCISRWFSFDPECDKVPLLTRYLAPTFSGIESDAFGGKDSKPAGRIHPYRLNSLPGEKEGNPGLVPNNSITLGKRAIWVWLKIQQEGLRRFFVSMFPLTRVPFWCRFFEPQPYCAISSGPPKNPPGKSELLGLPSTIRQPPSVQNREHARILRVGGS